MEANLFGNTRRPSQERVIIIYSNLSDDGGVIILRGELLGYKDTDMAMQWQYDDGWGWKDVPGANGISHAHPMTDAAVQYSWRLCVMESAREAADLARKRA